MVPADVEAESESTNACWPEWVVLTTTCAVTCAGVPVEPLDESAAVSSVSWTNN